MMAGSVTTVGITGGPLAVSAPENGISMEPIVDIQPHLAKNPRSLFVSYILALPPFGLLGAHHFYLGRPTFGVVYLFTGGLCLLGWVLDLIRMPCLVSQANKLRLGAPAKYKDTQDAYIMWLPPFGLLGFHQYYLGRYGWGVLYTLTFSLCGIGWLVDGLRMPSLVRRMEEQHQGQEEDTDKKLSDVYVLAMSPFGLLGAHQYYMGCWGFGVLYTCTAGLLGIGWCVDILTLNMQLQRRQHISQGQLSPHVLHFDEALKLHFPLGFLGLHQFYLRRPGWGILYLFTLGLFFIGWIMDICRLKALVIEANKKFELVKSNLEELHNRKLKSHSTQQGVASAYPVSPPIVNSNGVVICPGLPGTEIVTTTKVGATTNGKTHISLRMDFTIPTQSADVPSYLSSPPPAYEQVPMPTTSVRTMHKAMAIIEEAEE